MLRIGLLSAVVLFCSELAAVPLLAQPAAAPAAAPRQPAKPVVAVLPDSVAMQEDLVYATYGERKLHLDLFLPKSGAELRPAIVVVHGGGWMSGDKLRFRALAQTLAARGYATAAIEYRLGGEAKFPAAVHDCNAVVRWLRANAKLHAIDPERIGAVGGSAGGHLVGMMAAAPHIAELQGDGGNSEQSSAIQAAVVMAGPFDLTSGRVAERSRKDAANSFTNRWIGKTVDEAPDVYRLASPLTHLSKQTPPILFQNGEFDFPEANRASRQRLRELGVPTNILVYKDGEHGCWNRHPWFEPMVNDIDAFFAATFKIPPPAELPLLAEIDGGRMLAGPDRVEIQLTAKPTSGKVLIPRLNNPVGKIFSKGDPATKPLAIQPGITDWSIDFSPGDVDEQNPATIVVETIGRPYLPTIPRFISAGSDGSIVLGAHDAVTHGKMLRYEPQPHKNTVGYWVEPSDWCEWHFYSDRPGKFEVHILQGCGKGAGGSQVAVHIADQKLECIVEDTGHFQNFKDRPLGTVELSNPGVYTLAIKPLKKATVAVMDVRQIRLLPLSE